VLPQDLGIPIVPYAKLGLSGGYWRAFGADGTTSAGGKSGKGFTTGFSYSLGAAFLLDVLDRQTASSAEEGSGINHTYLFAELWGMELSGFGSSKAMRLTDRTFATGLAFEF
jgi:hypothetical protein